MIFCSFKGDIELVKSFGYKAGNVDNTFGCLNLDYRTIEHHASFDPSQIFFRSLKFIIFLTVTNHHPIIFCFGSRLKV